MTSRTHTLFDAQPDIPQHHLQADFVVIGGGVSGVCAAVAAARHGCTVVLAQNRPVLGGNASSEIGIGIVGASCAGGRWDSRETGILEEIQLAARRLDPTGGPASLDFALWEIIEAEERITLLLNTHISEVQMDGKRIRSVSGDQQGTEKRFHLSARWFADCTGDGTVAVRAGCRYMKGREAKGDYDEPDGLEEADHQTMGSSIYWVARDTGTPQPFQKPSWANSYSEKDFIYRPIHKGRFQYGFWWVETGGDTDDTITDNELIRDELWKIAYGLWDYVKNQGGDPDAETWVLDRVGLLPGKRESRRILGDLVLREQDLLGPTSFPDAIAYGGWTIDLHIPGGIRHTDQRPNHHISHGLYGIPWRSMLAKDAENLLMGGRLISATHLATASARVIATCAVIGQGLGTGVSLAKKYDCDLREVTKHAHELQQRLLADDAFIPGVPNQHPADASLQARVSASSHLPEGAPERIQDGWQRNRPELRPDWILDKKTNPPNENEVHPHGSAWISAPFEQDPEPWIELNFEEAEACAEIRPIFDSMLSLDLIQSSRGRPGREGAPLVLIRDFKVELFSGEERLWSKTIRDNLKRNPLLRPQQKDVTRVRLTVQRSWGSDHARIFALRVHREETNPAYASSN